MLHLGSFDDGHSADASFLRQRLQIRCSPSLSAIFPVFVSIKFNNETMTSLNQDIGNGRFIQSRIDGYPVEVEMGWEMHE